MKFPGAFYVDHDRTHLAVYSFYPDLYTRLPSSIRNDHVAHVAYKFGGKKGGIDVFHLLEDDSVEDFVDARKRFTFNGRVITKTEGPKVLSVPDPIIARADTLHDVQYEFLEGYQNTGLPNLIRADIGDFCEGTEAKKPQGTSLVHLPRIVPHTQIRQNQAKRLLEGGKQWFVESCLLEANIDFATGCMAGWVPVGKTSFDGLTATGYFLYPWGECKYCYATDKHLNFPKTLRHIDREQLKRELLGECCLEYGSETPLGRPVNVLRFGKRTETCTPFTLAELVTTLETCTETGTRGVITTKFLGFNPDIADLLRRTNSSLIYSIGFDELEEGAVMWGCDSEFRKEQAVRFREAGVNSLMYLSILGHKPPGKREIQTLKFARKHKLPVQLLPMRFGGRHLVDIFPSMDGLSWDDLKADPRQDLLVAHDEMGVRGRYSHTGGNKLNLEIPDPQWLEMMGERNNEEGDYRIGMCHHTSKCEYCAGCGILKHGFVKRVTKSTKRPIVLPTSDAIAPSKIKKRQSREVRSRPQKSSKGQGVIPEEHYEPITTEIEK
ncbi:MAG: hypothetical protein WC796_05980 [Candidatus Pacearchaeota archaeon]